jgi:alcohol dehydrogenase class IV
MLTFDIDWWPKRVICGHGSVQRLRQLAQQLGRGRALIVCGKSVAASKSLIAVKEQLGEMLAGIFPDIEMHAPLPILERGAAMAREAAADLVVSVGGGSAIDSGKGICLIHRVGKEYASYALPGSAAPMPELKLAHIAIPTTTGSGSEVTPTCGLRDPAMGHKRIFRDERLIPDVAILDPEMAAGTPAKLTACSGMTAVARCIEALYSGRRNPFRSALALHGLELLVRYLPESVTAPHNLKARANCLVASAMSAVAANVNTSAVHAIGHVVGGRYSLQHGIAHAILLSGGMRVMLPLAGEEQKQVLRTFGEASEKLTADAAGRQASELMRQFVSGLPVPQRLREVGVEHRALASLAEQASHDPILRSSGGNLSADSIRDLLEQAY